VTSPRRKPLIYAIAAAAAAFTLLISCSYSANNPSPSPTSGDSGPIESQGDTSTENRSTAETLRASKDRFGVDFLHKTKVRGSYWVSTWDKGNRRFSGVDPDDRWFDANHGSATYTVDDGRLEITGDTPRMYVHDPSLERQWRDVEITMYFRRVSDASIPFAGMTAVARANHLKTENGSDDVCDTRGYGGRFRFDGHSDFEKETAHPRNDSVASKKIFPSGMPSDTWIGYKFLVFDRDDGVHLELWRDLANGKNGGDWQRVNAYIDDGHRGFGNVACAPGVDPAMALTNADNRIGSESGKPNVSVYFRSDGIDTDGLMYKWGSVREIEPE
jgi:hypothetical protein